MDITTLVVMAAGMGSRFGGLKQIEPVDKYGHILIDYSIYDAILAGFRRVVFVINREIERDFKDMIASRISKWNIEVDYAFQEMTKLPDGYSVSPQRKKPLGTAHAIACLFGMVNTPFAVINADDFYGREAFIKIFEFLNRRDGECCMVGYRLGDTLSSSGNVSRGVCRVEQGRLCEIRETRGIFRDENRIISQGGRELSPDSTVSMNFWGLTPEVIEECRSRLPSFLDKNLDSDPLGCEFYLPELIYDLIFEEKVSVKVLDSNSKWYGVTYKKDKSEVSLALENMIKNRIYPVDL